MQPQSDPQFNTHSLISYTIKLVVMQFCVIKTSPYLTDGNVIQYGIISITLPWDIGAAIVGFMHPRNPWLVRWVGAAAITIRETQLAILHLPSMLSVPSIVLRINTIDHKHKMAVEWKDKQRWREGSDLSSGAFSVAIRDWRKSEAYSNTLPFSNMLRIILSTLVLSTLNTTRSSKTCPRLASCNSPTSPAEELIYHALK